MFTGIIQAVGRVKTVSPRGEDARVMFDSGGLDLSEVAVGDSIAVSGVCLTAVELGSGVFGADVSAETLRCTTGFREGDAVNLEPALRLSDRLGGHLVSGHVDGVGEVVAVDPVGECMRLAIRAPRAVARFIAPKGSVAVNGVALTVNRVDGDNFDLNLIPHTLEMTNLKHLAAGTRVNLEADVMARYALRLLETRENQL